MRITFEGLWAWGNGVGIARATGARRGTRIGRGTCTQWAAHTQLRIMHNAQLQYGIIGAMPIHPYETDFSESRFRVARG
jgi:hypothetical protein